MSAIELWRWWVGDLGLEGNSRRGARSWLAPESTGVVGPNRGDFGIEDEGPGSVI